MGKPAATVITSSPGFNFRSAISLLSNEESARRFAEDPELTIKACRIPTVLAKKDSNFSVCGPAVNQKSKLAPTALINSCSPNTLPVTGISLLPGTKTSLTCEVSRENFAKDLIKSSKVVI